MKTGFIIVNYNDAKTTLTLLENIESYTCLDKIVVVDNGSTDSSFKTLSKRESKKIKIIDAGKSNGYSSGINIGAKYLIDSCGIENIFVSNADIIIKKEEDIKKLVKELKPARVAIVAPTILEKGSKNRGWKIPTPRIELLLNIPFLHRFFRKKYLYYPRDHYETKTAQVEVVSGCFFLIKGSVLKHIGYLDENTFLYFEENILATILKQKKYKTIVLNTVSVIHNHSVTIDKSVNRFRKLKMMKESQYYFEKEYNGASKLTLFLFRVTNKINSVVYRIYYRLRDNSKGGRK